MVQRQLTTERVQVAATLRRMREDAGCNREQAAEVLGCTPSKIGDLENGRSGPKPAELEKLLEFYGVQGEEREEMVRFARESRYRKPKGTYTDASVSVNYRRALDLEAQAVSSTFYSGELIPGILQVRSYAEAILSWNRHNKPAEVRKLADIRMARKSELTRGQRPPLRYWAVLGEAALRSGVGGNEVMVEQVAHLIELNTDLPNVVIQVLPTGSGVHALLGLTLTLYRFSPPAPDIMALEGHGRSAFHDDHAGVVRAAEDVQLASAKALGRDESTDYLRKIQRDLEGP